MNPTESALVYFRDLLATIEGVKSCRIGREPEITPDSYPLIRLVPTRSTYLDEGTVRFEVLVYFGLPIFDFEGGLEAVYSALWDLEEKIRALFRSGGGWGVRHVDTVNDEDAIDAYKLFAARFEVIG